MNHQVDHRPPTHRGRYPTPLHATTEPREKPMPDQSRKIRTPDELLQAAYGWVRKTGWPTYAQDQTIAGDVYEKWIKATDAEYAATQSRDFDLLGDLLRAALAEDRKSTRLNSSHPSISYAVFCL